MEVFFLKYQEPIDNFLKWFNYNLFLLSSNEITLEKND